MSGFFSRLVLTPTGALLGVVTGLGISSFFIDGMWIAFMGALLYLLLYVIPAELIDRFLNGRDDHENTP